MKVCYISSFYPPLIFGGAEIYVSRVSEKLVQEGFEVIVITTDSKISIKPSIEERNGVKVYRFHPLNIYAISNTLNKPRPVKLIWYGIDLFNLHSFRTVKDILKKEEPDIVHIHNFKGFSLAFNAVKSLNLPLIFTVHDYFIECPKENLFKNSGEICNRKPVMCHFYARIQRYLKDNRPDIITAPSQFVINRVKKDGFFGGVKAIKLPLGVEVGGNEKIEKDYETIDILYVGRLNKHKGLHVLIEAFKQLKYKNIHLHVVGTGSDMEEFKKIAGPDPNITFYGFIPNNKLIELYKKANIVVVPSIWYEVFGIVIIESFKYGIPVIGSRIGGIPELIENGHNGYLFEPGNMIELKNLLESLIENPLELKRLSDNAFENAREYSMETHINKLKKLYKDVHERIGNLR